jgi:hypothetical protein
MTITELAPLRTDSERALLGLLDALGRDIDRDGFRRHEHAVQALTREIRHLTPGAAATLGDRSGSAIARRHSFQVAARVLVRCGGDVTRERVAGLLGAYVRRTA